MAACFLANVFFHEVHLIDRHEKPVGTAVLDEDVVLLDTFAHDVFDAEIEPDAWCS